MNSEDTLAPTCEVSASSSQPQNATPKKISNSLISAEALVNKQGVKLWADDSSDDDEIINRAPLPPTKHDAAKLVSSAKPHPASSSNSNIKKPVSNSENKTRNVIKQPAHAERVGSDADKGSAWTRNAQSKPRPPPSTAQRGPPATTQGWDADKNKPSSGKSNTRQPNRLKQPQAGRDTQSAGLFAKFQEYKRPDSGDRGSSEMESAAPSDEGRSGSTGGANRYSNSKENNSTKKAHVSAKPPSGESGKKRDLKSEVRQHLTTISRPVTVGSSKNSSNTINMKGGTGRAVASSVVDTKKPALVDGEFEISCPEDDNHAPAVALVRGSVRPVSAKAFPVAGHNVRSSHNDKNTATTPRAKDDHKPKSNQTTPNPLGLSSLSTSDTRKPGPPSSRTPSRTVIAVITSDDYEIKGPSNDDDTPVSTVESKFKNIVMSVSGGGDDDYEVQAPVESPVVSKKKNEPGKDKKMKKLKAFSGENPESRKDAGRRGDKKTKSVLSTAIDAVKNNSV